VAVKIKLQRKGKRSRPFYRIVVQEEASATAGRIIGVVGHYDPLLAENKVRFEEAGVKAWLQKGAVPTEKVRVFLGQAGILPAVSFEGKTKKKPRAQEKKTEKEAAPAEAKEEGKKEEAKQGEAASETAAEKGGPKP
jgi:small subunit ribosomal protein S16